MDSNHFIKCFQTTNVSVRGQLVFTFLLVKVMSTSTVLNNCQLVWKRKKKLGIQGRETMVWLNSVTSYQLTKNSLKLRATLEASLIAQLVKNLSAVQETWVRFPGWEDPLEKEIAAHSSILAWRIPWTEEPGRLHFMESQESDTT